MFELTCVFIKYGQKINILQKKENISKGEFKGNEEIWGIDLSKLDNLEAELCYNCPYLYKVRLSPKLQSIPRKAFGKCRDLKEINLPSYLREIGEKAFYFCGIEDILLPDSLKEIGNEAFLNCRNLKEVTVPEGVEIIGNRAFSGCLGLKRIVFKGNPRKIGEKSINKPAVIVCLPGGTAESYARENGNPVEYL